MLASFMVTNKLGEYPLPLAWVGSEKVTARLGWYATKDAVSEQTNDPWLTNRWLEFDKLTVGRENLHPDFRADRFISTGDEIYGRAYYRASLPSDTELLGMRDLMSLSNLFGWNPFAQATNYTGDTLWVGIRYFTLRPYDFIETVQVTFMRREQESRIDSIVVKRGRMHPYPKAE